LRHDFHLTGHAFRLRPVDEQDAAFIVALRQNASRFLNKGPASEAKQLAWLTRYFERQGDFYFVVETIRKNTREGLIGLYDVDFRGGTAQWGRWVLNAGSSGAIESALLVYRFAFDELQLGEVKCRTLADNFSVIAFHDSCGLPRSVAPVMIEFDGQQRPAIEHALPRAEWPQVMQRLDRLAKRIASSMDDHSPSAKVLG
jgi:RimJ/RimL family protein N-acetyltransferase